jgi:hypothetical protein
MIEEDHYVSVKWSNVSFIIFSLNINDILLAKYNKDMIVATKMWLSSNFEMKDMDEANYIQGLKIFRFVSTYLY